MVLYGFIDYEVRNSQNPIIALRDHPYEYELLRTTKDRWGKVLKRNKFY